MSRFVSAGTDQNPTSTDTAVSSSTTSVNDDGWAKARQQVESVRAPKHIDPAQQANEGKSLYDVLQANKAAKQEAFEEATKLRNQFRPLDDSEIEFLDSVRNTERSKEIAEKQETASQLDEFRRQRAAAEKQAREQELAEIKSGQGDGESKGAALPASDKGNSDAWTVKRKRRRTEKEDENDIRDEVNDPNTPESKLRKSSIAQDRKHGNSPPNKGPSRSADEKSALDSQSDGKPITSPRVPPTQSKSAMQGLGLNAYGSDSDD